MMSIQMKQSALYTLKNPHLTYEICAQNESTVDDSSSHNVPPQHVHNFEPTHTINYYAFVHPQQARIIATCSISIIKKLKK